MTAALILDTSGLLAAIDAAQRLHGAAREALEGATGPLILSPFVLAELNYLLATSVGAEAELALLDEVSRGTYRLEAFSTSDVAEAKSMVEQYANFGGVGLADASKPSYLPGATARAASSRSTSASFARCAGRGIYRSACSPWTFSSRPRARARAARRGGVFPVRARA